MEDIRPELKALIVSSLRLTDVRPEELDCSQPLIGGSLEVDSIDILQLIVEIEKKYGIKLVSGKFDRSAWENINSLAAAIQSKMQEAGRVY